MHASQSDFTPSAQATILYKEFENYTFKIIATSSKGHWGNLPIFLIVCFTGARANRMTFAAVGVM